MYMYIVCMNGGYHTYLNTMYDPMERKKFDVKGTGHGLSGLTWKRSYHNKGARIGILFTMHLFTLFTLSPKKTVVESCTLHRMLLVVFFHHRALLSLPQLSHTVYTKTPGFSKF